MFRRIASAIGLVVVLSLIASCGGLRDVFESTDVDVDIDRQTVPGFTPLPSCDAVSELLLENESIGAFTINFRQEDELEGMDLSRLDHVTLDRIRLRVVDVPAGDQDDFDFVDSIRIFADDPGDDRPEVLVAELDPVPENQTEIVIPGTGVDIKDIVSDNFIARIEADGRPPCDDVHFRGVAEFQLDFF
ncbi:MAG: hypothetical protein QOD06_745 [Candidatus Binatota bacterium]|nr:hypothetical protein [Candidatus Binatota bacterium]